MAGLCDCECLMIELTKLRQPNSKTYDLENGKRRCLIQQGLHYFDKSTNQVELFSHEVRENSVSRFTLNGN